MPEDRCPLCRLAREITWEDVGTATVCPSCGNEYTVPSPAVDVRPRLRGARRTAAAPPGRYSGFAIAGFVLSLCFIPVPMEIPKSLHAASTVFSLVGITLAIVFSAIGLSHVKSGERERGGGLATAGLLIGVADLVLFAVLRAAGL